MKWLLKPRLNHGIAVICKGCKRKYYRTIYSTKENSKPFVVVTTSIDAPTALQTHPLAPEDQRNNNQQTFL
jgi:hypothetical protein